MDLSSNFFFESIPHCFQDITFGKNHSSEFNHNYVISIAYTKYGSVSENDLPLTIVYGYYSQEEANFITKTGLAPTWVAFLITCLDWICLVTT